MATRNYLRMIQLQLRAGYLREVPVGYELMRRSPPLMVRREGGRKIPRVYLPTDKLVERILKTKPHLAPTTSAVVATAPFALRLARLQLGYMEQGMSEEDALKKAETDVDLADSGAFDELERQRSLVAAAAAASSSSSSSSATVTLPAYFMDSRGSTITYWKNRIDEVGGWGEMAVHEQALLDHFLCSSVLGWSDEDAKRYLTDPIMYDTFCELRASMFPVLKQETDAQEAVIKKKVLNKTLQQFGLKAQLLTSASPFYVEDYLHWFERTLQSSPEKWSSQERDGFRRWVLSTLTHQHQHQYLPDMMMPAYLDDTVHKYFPHLRSPAPAQKSADGSSSSSFTVSDLKSKLYTHGVGYKPVNVSAAGEDAGAAATTPESGETTVKKTLVKRFYRIPMIMFPIETIVTDIITMLANTTPSRGGLSSWAGIDQLVNEVAEEVLHEGVLEDMQEKGITRDMIMARVHAEVNPAAAGMALDQVTTTPAAAAATTATATETAAPPKPAVSGTDIDIQALLSDLDASSSHPWEAEGEDTSLPLSAMAGAGGAGESASSDSDDSDDDDEDDVDPNEVDEATMAILGMGKVDHPHLRELDGQEWEEALAKYSPPSTTELQKRRNAYYDARQFNQWGKEQTVAHLRLCAYERWENETITRARLEVEFNKRSAARRQVEWGLRGVSTKRSDYVRYSLR